jgi:hypothetical protein
MGGIAMTLMNTDTDEIKRSEDAMAMDQVNLFFTHISVLRKEQGDEFDISTIIGLCRHMCVNFFVAAIQVLASDFTSNKPQEIYRPLLKEAILELSKEVTTILVHMFDCGDIDRIYDTIKKLKMRH